MTVGWSAQADARRAGTEAAERALAQMAPLRPQVAMVFGSSWFAPDALLEGIRSALGGVPLIGGSTAGEITLEGPRSHSCVIVLVASKTLTCSVGLGEAIDRSPREAGHRAAYAASQELRDQPRLGFLWFGDGLVTNAADVVRGLQEVLGTGTLIVGGMTGDDLRLAHTFQLFNDRVLHHCAVGTLFGGAGRLGIGIEHGFSPISKPRHVTRARANILYELDRKPAASVYEEYFGTEVVRRMQHEGMTRERVAYPLGIQYDTAPGWMLRNVVSFQADGSVACTGDVPEGAWLQLMIGSRALALDAARKAAQQAIQSMNRLAGVLVFDSSARRQLLGPQHAATEIAQIRAIVGASVPLAGCYTYGEQAPLDATAGYARSTTQTGSVLIIALGT